MSQIGSDRRRSPSCRRHDQSRRFPVGIDGPTYAGGSGAERILSGRTRRMLLVVAALILLVGLVDPSSLASAGVTHSLTGRGQVGVLYDSNVLEALEDPRDDFALQLFGAAEYRLQLHPRVAATSIARLGLLRYLDVSDDSRVIGEGNFTLAYRSRGGSAVGGSLFIEGRDYADSTSSRGYELVRQEAFVQARFASYLLESTIGRTWIDYKVTPGREQDGYRLDLSIHRSVLKWVTLRARGGAGTFDFNRRAVLVEDEIPVVQDYDRKEDFFIAALEAEYLHGTYLRLGWSWLDNESNSFGNTFRFHRLHLVWRRRLQSANLSLGLHAQVEWRDYADDLTNFDVINFDSERELNNYVIAEIGRPVLERTLLKLRGGWYRNESIFRARLYEKVLVETVLEWRF